MTESLVGFGDVVSDLCLRVLRRGGFVFLNGQLILSTIINEVAIMTTGILRTKGKSLLIYLLLSLL